MWLNLSRLVQANVGLKKSECIRDGLECLDGRVWKSLGEIERIPANVRTDVKNAHAILQKAKQQIRIRLLVGAKV
jgi:hypothetical protein